MPVRRLPLDPLRRLRPPKAPDPSNTGTTAQGGDAPAAGSVRIVRPPLPKPERRRGRRTQVVLRPGAPRDLDLCRGLDTGYVTDHVWQLDSRQEGDELRISFRQVRLPRQLALTAEHRPPSLVNGAVRRGQCWIVAEEVESSPSAAAEPRPDEEARPSPFAAYAEAGATPETAWSHTVRRGSARAAIQLGLPQQPATRYSGPPAPGAGGKDTPGTVVGYAVVACAPGDDKAYVHPLVVGRGQRRKGIGSRLLAEAQRWAAAQGAAYLMADVAARNSPAMRLLQKAGFAFCGYNDRCYPNNEVAVFFACRLH